MFPGKPFCRLSEEHVWIPNLRIRALINAQVAMLKIFNHLFNMALYLILNHLSGEDIPWEGGQSVDAH